MNLKIRNGQFKDFISLYVAYEMLPKRKQAEGVLESLKAAGVAAGLQKLTNKQERERMYDPSGKWINIIKYVEENDGR